MKCVRDVLIPFTGGCPEQLGLQKLRDRGSSVDPGCLCRDARPCAPTQETCQEGVRYSP